MSSEFEVPVIYDINLDALRPITQAEVNRLEELVKEIKNPNTKVPKMPDLMSVEARMLMAASMEANQALSTLAHVLLQGPNASNMLTRGGIATGLIRAAAYVRGMTLEQFYASLLSEVGHQPSAQAKQETPPVEPSTTTTEDLACSNQTA